MKCAEYQSVKTSGSRLLSTFTKCLLTLLLVSCRSHQEVMHEEMDSVTVTALRITDSLHTDFAFRFDSLTYTLYDDSGTHVRGVMNIRKGAVSKVQEQTKSTTINDSTATKKEVHIEETFVPPRSTHDIWATSAIIAIILIIFYLTRRYR